MPHPQPRPWTLLETRGESLAPGRFYHVRIAPVLGRFHPVGPVLCPQIPHGVWMMVLMVSLVSLQKAWVHPYAAE